MRLIDGTSYPLFLANAHTIFTSSGTYVPPAHANLFMVLAVGGGGGGGQAQPTAAGQWSCGTGGAAGEFGIAIVTREELGASVAVTVGAGGSPGSSGGFSKFGTFLSVFGGAGGGFAPANSIQQHIAAPGGLSGSSNFLLGGSYRGGDAIISGASGSMLAVGGAGGDGIFAGGGGAVVGSGAGNNGYTYGGAGSGAANDVSSGGKNGGSGFKGVVGVIIIA